MLTMLSFITKHCIVLDTELRFLSSNVSRTPGSAHISKEGDIII